MLDHIYITHRPLMFHIAYRMLGSVSDAEDIVQDVFSQYMQMDRDGIVNDRAYLAKMTTNRCLNLLKSARRVREAYMGPWLPEPLPADVGTGTHDFAERRENIGYAYVVLLQRLSPLERAVYLSREALGFEYRDIAGMLDKTEVNCRKIFSRARNKLLEATDNKPNRTRRKTAQATEHEEQTRMADTPTESQEQFVEAFLRACDTGDFKPLLSLLLDEVTLLSDGGGKVRAALNPIRGIDRVRAFYEGLAAKGVFCEGFEAVSINGEPGIARRDDGVVTMVITTEREPEGSRIRTIYMVLNPDKLRQFNQSSPGTYR
ncbi:MULTISPECIES: sigma-70 family RNA polymerase sigma factor [Paenibacillus]|nr:MULTISPECIES: sigma-70 family RNA polymerase sigma factor [Paenibacillus]